MSLEVHYEVVFLMGNVDMLLWDVCYIILGEEEREIRIFILIST